MRLPSISLRAALAALLLLEILLFVLLARVRLASVPLDREEGEFAYAARYMPGELPYRDTFTQKGPLPFFFYRLAFDLLGDAPVSPRLLGCLCALAAIALFRWCCRPWLSEAGCWAATAALAAVMSEPFAASTSPDLLALPLLLLGMRLTWQAHENGGLAEHAAAGLLFGAAATARPLAGVFAVVALVPILRGGSRAGPRAAALASGFLVPAAAFSIYFHSAGSLGGFWEGFLFSGWDWTAHPLPGGLYAILETALRAGRSEWPVLGLAGWGLWGLLRNRPATDAQRLLLGWAAASCLALLLCRHFLPRYWLLMGPALALLAGAGMERIQGRISPWAAVLLAQAAFLAGNFHTFFGQRPQFMHPDRQPYAESMLVAEYIRNTTRPEDAVLIYGSEPQILYYARRRSATRYLHFYPVLNLSPRSLERQKEVWMEVGRARPALIVVAPQAYSLPQYYGIPAFLNQAMQGLQAERYEADAAMIHSPRERVTRLLMGPKALAKAGRFEPRHALFLVSRRNVIRYRD